MTVMKIDRMSAIGLAGNLGRVAVAEASGEPLRTTPSQHRQHNVNEAYHGIFTCDIVLMIASCQE
jgi:hypothetical protein